MADDGGRNTSPQLVGAIVLALAVVDFVVQNRQRVEIHFLFFSFDARVWMALLITSVLAILAAEFFSHVLRKRRNN
jgi:uncharacterized integral membrane protein